MTCSRSGPCLNFLVLAIKWLGFSLKSDKHRGNRNAHKKQTKYECCTTIINELWDTFYMRYFSMSSFELGSIWCCRFAHFNFYSVIFIFYVFHFLCFMSSVYNVILLSIIDFGCINNNAKYNMCLIDYKYFTWNIILKF